MIFNELATNVHHTELFSQHTIADLNSDITFIVLFSQGKSLQQKVINTHTHTHTHTHTQHTHTHTHTHTHSHTFQKKSTHFKEGY